MIQKVSIGMKDEDDNIIINNLKYHIGLKLSSFLHSNIRPPFFSILFCPFCQPLSEWVSELSEVGYDGGVIGILQRNGCCY